MSGVVALLIFFAAALAFTLLLIDDSSSELEGIEQYHLPLTKNMNLLDIYTFEMETIAHMVVNGGYSRENNLPRQERAKKLTDEVDRIFKQSNLLAEEGSNDKRNDLEDRLAIARSIGTIRTMESQTQSFMRVALQAVDLGLEGKTSEAKKALRLLGQYEYLCSTYELLRVKATELTANSILETNENIHHIIRANLILFAIAGGLGFFVFLGITGRLQTAFRRLTSAFHETTDGKYSEPLPVTSKDEIGDLTTSFNTMVEQLKSKEKLREAFGQFLDPRIVANVVNPITGELRQSAERRNLTIFFSDIAGFSAIGEQLTADTLVRLLNRYFTSAAEIIRRNHGIVDKFIGDGVMAFWASPFSEGESHAHHACLATLEMRFAFAEIAKDISNITGLRRNLPKFHVRMALATGDTLIGTVGSDTTKSFTVIGDTVNIASRLEGVNKIYGTDLIINEDCYRLVETEVEVRELDFVTVYGKTEPIRIYELLSKGGELDAPTTELCHTFRIALDHYRQQKWQNAEQGFRACLEIKQHDGPSLEFLTRIATFSRTPPPKDWNGVWQTASK